MFIYLIRANVMVILIIHMIDREKDEKKRNILTYNITMMGALGPMPGPGGEVRPVRGRLCD